MKIRALLQAIGAGVMALSFSSCTQPKIDCRAGAGGPFWAIYTLTSGQGACSMYTGDSIGMGTYYATRKDGVDTVRDFDKPSTLAVKAERMGLLVGAREAAGTGLDENADHAPYSLGKFAAVEPDDENFCRVDALSAAVQELGLVP